MTEGFVRFGESENGKRKKNRREKKRWKKRGKKRGRREGEEMGSQTGQASLVFSWILIEEDYVPI